MRQVLPSNSRAARASARLRKIDAQIRRGANGGLMERAILFRSG
jgi:hypothetical protein